jgi:hypothetical protein
MPIVLDGSTGITLPSSGDIFNASLIRSDTSNPPTIQNSSGTEIGTLCRAWVNFNGQGTVAIRAAFNVSSITDNGVGTYTVNFATPMPDANYAVTNGKDTSVAGSPATFLVITLPTITTSSFSVINSQIINGSVVADIFLGLFAVFR